MQGLNGARQFATAIKFSKAVVSDSRADWEAAIFRAWGGSEPEEALRALDSMGSGDHAAFYRPIVEGWSVSDPRGLADHATSMPAGEDRTYAYSSVFERWSLQDPEAMSDWISKAPPSADLDPAVALMLTRSDRVNRPSALAIRWAESISDPSLRFSTTEHLVKEWMQDDAAAARAYAQSAAWMTPAQRTELMQVINAPVSELVDVGDK